MEAGPGLTESPLQALAPRRILSKDQLNEGMMEAFQTLQKNLCGGDIYGQIQPFIRGLGNISENLFLQVLIGVGTLICLDVEEIQRDLRSEDPGTVSGRGQGGRGELNN